MSMELCIAILWLILSVILDLVANWALKRSEGFRKKLWGIAAIINVSLAFACIGQTLHAFPLSIAYALWSVLGIMGTLTIDKILFGQKLSRQKYVAVAVLTVGIVMMNMG